MNPATHINKRQRPGSLVHEEKPIHQYHLCCHPSPAQFDTSIAVQPPNQTTTMSQTQTPAPMTTTKAWTFSRLGPYRETLQLTPSHPIPPFPPQPPLPKSNPKPEEWILIRVSHAALNPADVVLLSVLPFFLRSKPVAVPAADFTGTVIDVWSPPTAAAAAATGGGGGGGTAGPPRFAKGDDVVCFPTLAYTLATGSGGLQGVLALPARYATKIPPGKTTRDAAGLLLCGCTADMQVARAGVEPGQRVLVVGASGGLGSMVVQMVREKVGKGGFVVGVCSGKNKAMVEGLGADEVSGYPPGNAPWGLFEVG